MASPPIPVEDQTDEDFFDKLVDDEVISSGNDTGFKDSVDDNGAQVFENANADEIDTHSDSLDGPCSVGGDAQKGGKDDIISCKLEGQVEKVGIEHGGGGVTELTEPDQRNVTEFNDHTEGGESALVSTIGGNGANIGGGIKEVQWSAFGGGAREASYSDFLSEFVDNSVTPFRAEASGFAVASDTAAGVPCNQAVCSSSHAFDQSNNSLQHGSATQQTTYGIQHGSSSEMQDQSSSEYWESLYPGWRYDPNTGQWHQLDGPDNAGDKSTGEGAATDSSSHVNYLQQTAQSIAGSMTKASTTDTLSYWNQTSAGSTQYPAHMVFDLQYPGWYYDTIAQKWRSLDAYASSINQSVSLDHNQQMSNGSPTGNYYADQTMSYEQPGTFNNYSQQDQLMNWGVSANNHQQQDINMAQSEPFGNSDAVGSTKNTGNGSMSVGQSRYSADQRTGVAAFEKSSFYEQTSRGFDSVDGFNGFQGFNGATGFQTYPASEQFLHHNNQRNMDSDQQFSTAYFNDPKVLNFSQQPLQNSIKRCAASERRSSAGRPLHALVTFGFGGKLIVMKNQSNLPTQPAYASQDSAGIVINVLNIMEVAVLKNGGVAAGFSACDYISSLCRQSFPGPLVSGNVGTKELNKWIDDRIANCATLVADYRKGEALKMLFSLLKIACQFYGKLRSAFGTDLVLKENDCPESALAKLFSSAKRNHAQFSAVNHCLQNIPSEGQIQATVDEVQKLLVLGRRMEALQRAQEGQLWGPAIVIASFLGEQFYGETVKQMALHQLVAGSPLRTLCLLLAGQRAEVFSNSLANSPPSGVNVSQPVQVVPSCMLDEWEENLAIITANRTTGDEPVITHLGDNLWKERGEVTTAHICYLVAEVNIEFFSEKARLCLVGADHLKCPRTYASPEAIQRTELYEYARVLGNSQFILLPFQPYKLIYACMLAEVGRLSDSLKYCQAVLKSLKTGRSSEVDAWRHIVSSLEERIKIHQQGGYATNLAPTKLVGKLLNFFDHTAHRVVGGLPPHISSPSHGNGQHIDHDHQSRLQQMSTSQSTMAMSSLMPSASTAGSNHKSFHNRSISEPDIGRTPRKDRSPKKSDPPGRHVNSSATTGSSSRFGRFGSQIFQKTLGLVLRSRPDKQAKLGEKNKFYYDEKLKRWVEEGAEPPAEEPALAPPPTIAAFMNGVPDNDKKDEFVKNTIHANGQPEFKSANSFEKKSGTPPLPSGANQFSARGRMGVRARYVDTFNKGGSAQANMFQSPSPSGPARKPSVANAKFLVPTPLTPLETNTTRSTQEAVHTDEDTMISNRSHSSSSPRMTPPPTPPSFIPRYPSMEELMNKGIIQMPNSNGNGPIVPPLSRRTSSWSGVFGDAGSGESRSPGEGPGFSPPSTCVMPGNSPPMPFSTSSTALSEDLQDVQL